jgi:hypothetical protein
MNECIDSGPYPRMLAVLLASDDPRTSWFLHKPHVERKDVKGNDTFEISDWWKVNCAILSRVTTLLRYRIGGR